MKQRLEYTSRRKRRDGCKRSRSPNDRASRTTPTACRAHPSVALCSQTHNLLLDAGKQSGHKRAAYAGRHAGLSSTSGVRIHDVQQPVLLLPPVQLIGTNSHSHPEAAICGTRQALVTSSFAIGSPPFPVACYKHACGLYDALCIVLERLGDFLDAKTASPLSNNKGMNSARAPTRRVTSQASTAEPPRYY